MVRVDFSDGSSFFMASKILLEEDLSPGDDLDEESIAGLKRRSRLYEAENKAISFLSRSLHSARTLRLKLIKRGFDPDIVDEILKRLMEQGHVDDRLFAEEWLRIRFMKHPEGRMALISGLRKRGVPREIVEWAVNSFFTPEMEEECARRFVERLRKRSSPSKEELSDKLYSRHFRARVIREILSG